jgi:hypothetical protein
MVAAVQERQGECNGQRYSFYRQDVPPGRLRPAPQGTQSTGQAPIHSARCFEHPRRPAEPSHPEHDLYLLEQFQALAAYHEQLSFTPVLSETASDSYRTGLVSTAVSEDLGDLDGWKAYVAGPPAMVEATMAGATAAGLRSLDLHADIFFTPDELPRTSAAQERRTA